MDIWYRILEVIIMIFLAIQMGCMAIAMIVVLKEDDDPLHHREDK
jgi:hypothetical protein